jgi:hypothetical protein
VKNIPLINPSDPVTFAPRQPERTRSLPVTFEAAVQWPHCAEIIMRIHNQGHDMKKQPRFVGEKNHQYGLDMV